MGQWDFPKLYQDASKVLGERPTIKVSYFCDKYEASKPYIGLIVYQHAGNFTWKAFSAGHNGRAFYVLIQRADRGMGKPRRVHADLFRKMFRPDARTLKEDEFLELCRTQTRCGGFSILDGVVHPVATMNAFGSFHHAACKTTKTEADTVSARWRSDGSTMLSEPEVDLVRLAVEEWKQNGPHAVLRLPPAIDTKLVNYDRVYASKCDPAELQAHKGAGDIDIAPDKSSRGNSGKASLPEKQSIQPGSDGLRVYAPWLLATAPPCPKVKGRK